MKISTRTLVLSTLGAAIVAGLLFVSFRQVPIPVNLAPVTRAPLEVTINADGQTRVRDLFEVASPIAGIALRSPVREGDTVQIDETVVAIVQPASSGLLDARTRRQAEASLQEALAARDVAQADMQQAEETVNFAQAQFDRAQALVNRGVASVTRLEDDAQRLLVAKASRDAAKARIDMTEGTIERARASLVQSAETEHTPSSCCIELKAPASGVVLSVASMSERPVSVGAPLVSIGDARNLEIVSDILSSDAVRLEPDSLAYVDRWGGTQLLRARLDRIAPQASTKVSALGIEEQRVDAYFTLESDSQERSALGDGFAVFLRIVEWRADDVLQIPLSAIFRQGDDWAVFIAADGRANQRIVTLGRRNERVVEVQSGVEPGEMVVTHPSDGIADGVALIERSKL